MKKKQITQHVPVTAEELEVKAKMLAGIDKYITLNEERKLANETSYVSNLDGGHYIFLYGKNVFEGLMVEDRLIS